MSLPSKRALLETLTKARLVDLARRHGVAVASSQTKAKIVAALSHCSRGEFRRLLGRLRRDDLRAMCRAHELPESARTKDQLIDTLLGPQQEYLSLVRDEPGTTLEESDTRYVATPKSQTAATGDVRRLAARGRARRGDSELGFEAKLWKAADKLRSNMDAAEYKHVVLGLLFLKYISDAHAQHRQHLEQQDAETEVDAPARYHDAGVFWVPPEARWDALRERARGPGGGRNLGRAIDEAMSALERDNEDLRGVLPRGYSDPNRPLPEPRRMIELIELFDSIGLGARDDRSRDVLGRVYEYFLTKFAAAEGKNGGQFYTPHSLVSLLVEMMGPEAGTVYDPACGSGGMFVQSERFARERELARARARDAHPDEAPEGAHERLRLYGQESNPTTWRLSKMNLTIRQIDADLGPTHADSFHRDLHPALRADYVLANPPFNAKDWGAARLRNDPRWRYGRPPDSNANFAWVQHFIHHLAPLGLAGFVLANGAMSVASSSEGAIRKAIVRDDLVDCMVALPAQLFYSTQIPVSLWILARSKQDPRFRDRRGETLFIDARDLGVMIDRTHRELTRGEIERVAMTYHAFRGDEDAGAYEDTPGFCCVARIDDIARQDYVLAPGRYVTPRPETVDKTRFDEEFEQLKGQLQEHFRESRALEQTISTLLEKIKRPPT